MSNQNTISPAIVTDKNTRRVLQSYRTQIDLLLGSGKNKDLKYISRKELIDTGLVTFNKDKGTYQSNILSTIDSEAEGFLDWLEGNFLNTFQDADFTIGAEAANIINVSIQLQDNSGNPVVGIHSVQFYLSNASTGASYATTVPDTSVTIGTNGDIQDLTGGLFLFSAITNSSGVFDIDIEHTAVNTFYLVIVLDTGKIDVSAAIAFA